MQKEVEHLRQLNQSLLNDLALTKKSQVSDASNLQESLAQLKAENEQLREEREKKLNESVQFKNLK